jgi:hypothetical protein
MQLKFFNIIWFTAFWSHFIFYRGALQTFLGIFKKWTKINVQFHRAMPFLFTTILGNLP